MIAASKSIQPIAETMPLVEWAFAAAAVSVAALACALCVSRWRGYRDVSPGMVAVPGVVVALMNVLVAGQDTPATWWGPAQWVATVSAVVTVLATVMASLSRTESVPVRGES